MLVHCHVSTDADLLTSPWCQSGARQRADVTCVSGGHWAGGDYDNIRVLKEHDLDQAFIWQTQWISILHNLLWDTVISVRSWKIDLKLDKRSSKLPHCMTESSSCSSLAFPQFEVGASSFRSTCSPVLCFYTHLSPSCLFQITLLHLGLSFVSIQSSFSHFLTYLCHTSPCSYFFCPKSYQSYLFWSSLSTLISYLCSFKPSFAQPGTFPVSCWFKMAYLPSAPFDEGKGVDMSLIQVMDHIG